ncbi:MAG: nitrate ABC transporter substrate-binding protein [Syntrophus sp. (in: bacteria)]|nr:nitrate ABC transporter substrate-binding protein [Syntrophus sp. (in: bacteria)]
MNRFKMNSRFTTLFLVALAVVIIFAAACQQQPPKPAVPPQKVTIAYPTTMLSILTHIAFEKGYFLAEGLAVTPQLHGFGKPALQSVLAGKADLALSADTPVMFAVAGGNKIHIVAMVGISRKAIAVVARKDRGISIPAELKGKKIGVTLGTTGDFYLDSFLSVRGIDKKNVKILDMKPGEMPDALAKGSVDAVSIWNPTLKQIERALKVDGVSFYDEHLYSDLACLSAQQDFVVKNPETIRKILKALLRAETFVKLNPTEAKRMIAELTATDPSLIEELWSPYDFRVALTQSLLVSLEDQTRWAIKNRLTQRKDMPNYLDFIYVEGLKAVKPDAVRIIR